MEQQLSPSKVGFRYGIFVGLALIIFGLILQLTGLYIYQGLSYLSYLILAVLMYMAHNAFKEGSDGFMRYGQGVSIGAIMSIVGGVISGIFTFIYLKYVDDSVLKFGMDKAYDDMVAKGMSDEEIDMAMGYAEKFTTPTMILVFSIVGMLFIGTIVSLIVSAITKKEAPKEVI